MDPIRIDPERGPEDAQEVVRRYNQIAKLLAGSQPLIPEGSVFDHHPDAVDAVILIAMGQHHLESAVFSADVRIAAKELLGVVLTLAAQAQIEASMAGGRA